MGSSVITGLLPTLYSALDIVSREMVGFIPAVTKDTSDERAAVGQQILIPIAPPTTLYDAVPSVTPPDIGDQNIGNVSMTIQKSKAAGIRWNGEQQKGLTNAGSFDGILQNQFAQAFRTICNAIETDCFIAAYQGASRAYGTPGSTPFGVAQDLSDFAQTRKLLDDNGAPQGDLQLVLGSAAVANLRGKQTILLKVNESGNDDLLRKGVITDIPVDGFWLHNSNAVSQIVKGTGSGYVTSGANAPGTASVALASGSGTINAGDIVTLAGDNNKYVVNSGIAAPGTAVIGQPGFLQTEASGTALTVGANYVPNMAFSKSAIQLITRPPAVPILNGRSMDMAIESELITDPISGITFEVAVYPGRLQMLIEIRVAWGVSVIKSNHVATLIG